MEKIGFERFEEKEMDHAEGDRRINEGERGGCGERMATILERNRNRNRSNNNLQLKNQISLKC